MSAQPDVSVLMATHNGEATLPRALAAYRRIAEAGSRWELIVVDNASTDATGRLLAQAASAIPLVTLRTERRGKNVALNLGVPLVRGALVVLTDDDAIPEPGLLDAYLDASHAYPDIDIFGGWIDPVWPEETPEWIARLVPLGATYAITPRDLVDGPVPAHRLWGPNMAIRRRIFDAGHRFDESIGPQAGEYVMGSEVEFSCRIERLGARARFLSRARVGHIIRPHQVRRDWIVRRAFRLGRHLYYQERPLFGGQVLFRGAPRWKYRRYLSEHLHRLWALVRRDFDAKFLADWELSFLSGYLSEASRFVGARQ